MSSFLRSLAPKTSRTRLGLIIVSLTAVSEMIFFLGLRKAGLMLEADYESPPDYTGDVLFIVVTLLVPAVMAVLGGAARIRLLHWLGILAMGLLGTLYLVLFAVILIKTSFTIYYSILPLGVGVLLSAWFLYLPAEPKAP